MAFDAGSAGLHAARPFYDHPSSIAKIERLLPLLPGRVREVVDAGCGDGRLGAELLTRGYRVAGIDAHAEALAAAAAAGIETHRGDLEGAWPLADASMDLVLLLDVLEHLVDPLHALHEASRVLRPWSFAIIAFPNHFDLRQRLEMLIGRGIVHWSHRSYADAEASRYAHVRFLRLPDVDALIRDAGFSVRAWQFNFMGGGIPPRRLLPPPLRRALVGYAPDLFSGKFIALVQKQAPQPVPEPKRILLAATPKGL